MLGGATRSFLAGTGVRFLASLSGVLLTCTFFAVLYVIVPYTKVRLRAAVAAGLVAGIAWELAKWGYTFVIGRFFRYHAIYGSVAAVPIFLLWLFVSWTILLFGARLAFVFQHASVLRSGAPRATSALGKEILAGQAMLQVARAFHAGEPALDPDDVAALIGAQGEESGEALAALRTAGLLLAMQDGSLVPARPLEKITLLDVRRAVTGAEPPVAGAAGSISGIVQEVADQSAERLAQVTFRELCERERGQAIEGAPDLGTVPDPPNVRSARTT
jgi:membrane protein